MSPLQIKPQITHPQGRAALQFVHLLPLSRLRSDL